MYILYIEHLRHLSHPIQMKHLSVCSKWNIRNHNFVDWANVSNDTFASLIFKSGVIAPADPESTFLYFERLVTTYQLSVCRKSDRPVNQVKAPPIQSRTRQGGVKRWNPGY